MPQSCREWRKIIELLSTAVSRRGTGHCTAKFECLVIVMICTCKFIQLLKLAWHWTLSYIYYVAEVSVIFTLASASRPVLFCCDWQRVKLFGCVICETRNTLSSCLRVNLDRNARNVTKRSHLWAFTQEVRNTWTYHLFTTSLNCRLILRFFTFRRVVFVAFFLKLYLYNIFTCACNIFAT